MFKARFIILMFFCITLISCESEDLTMDEGPDAINELNEKRRPPSGPAIFNCSIGYDVQISNQYSIPENDPLVTFTWDFGTALVACNINAYIEISDTVNGGASSGNGTCSYQFINESYPIDIYDSNPLVLNINYLTEGPPHLVPNPNSPTGYNEIYGSKCFFWRLKLIGNSCSNVNDRCVTTTDWAFFEWTI